MPTPYDHEHEGEVVPFATANFRGQTRKFGIKTDDRRRHVYIIGKTGMGKTTLLENFVISDINAGHGLAYVDPHGDTADKILDYIPPHRLKDVVYFNPADMANPVGFNILEITHENQKHLVASGLMGVFKKIWPDVWSPRMEYILLNCVLALLDTPGSTLLGISRILADKEYRKTIVDNVRDPIVKAFWLTEFAKYTDKFASEAIAPVQNKVGQFLSAAIIRNIVAQEKSTINVREIMDERKIFVVNLSKGLIGEDSSKLLGGMLITRLQLAAMERVDMLEKDRQDFYLYVDEFQNFATESFANILSEARKYRLSLITAHQYIEQLAEEVAAAVFGNVGTIIAFRVGANDAEHLAKEFAPTFVEEDIINLAKYDIYLKLMIDGVSSSPFSASTLSPIAVKMGSREKALEMSRKLYSIKREDIEARVNSWSGYAGLAKFGAPGPAMAAAPGPGTGAGNAPGPMGQSPQAAPFANSERQYEAKCARCGKDLRLKFPPDPSRPFFCKECLPLAKSEGLIKPPAAAPQAPSVKYQAPKPPSPKPAPPPPPRPIPPPPPRPAPDDVPKEASFDAAAEPVVVPKLPKPAPLPKLGPLPQIGKPQTPNPKPQTPPKPQTTSNPQTQTAVPKPPPPRPTKSVPPPPKEGMFGGKIRLVKELDVKDEIPVEPPKPKPPAPPAPLPPPPPPPTGGPKPLEPGQAIRFDE